MDSVRYVIGDGSNNTHSTRYNIHPSRFADWRTDWDLAGSTIQMIDLYKSHNVQWWDDIPFQTVEKIKEEEGVVTFTTEWPVRELNCESEEFYQRFYKY